MADIMLQTAMITPVTRAGTLDYDALDRLVNRVLQAGHIGFSVLGSTGEGASVPLPVRRELRQAVLARVNGRVPVFTGIIGNIASDIEEDLHRCADLDLSGILVPPPSYYPMDHEELRDFYLRLADMSPFPLMLYNIPPFTKISLPPETVASLARHPRIMGIKDSSRNFDYLLRLISLTRHDLEFAVLVGTETLVLPAMVAGAAGAVLGSANIVPEWIARLGRQISEGAWDEARDTEDDLVQLAEALRKTDGARGFKYATALIDHHEGCLMAPYHRLHPTSPAAQAIMAALQKFHLIRPQDPA